jgi:CHAD domain-containing protein
MMKITKESNIGLGEYLDLQVEIFKGYLIVTRATFNKESIHQMRVTVKRINTFYKLKKDINFPIMVHDNLFEIIKQVYAASGRLRDLHIQKAILKAYQQILKIKMPLLVKYLHNVEKGLERDLFQITGNIDPLTMKKPDRAKEVPETIPDYPGLEQQCDIFIINKASKINQKLLIIESENNLHDLRKQIKQVFFVLEFLQEYYPNSKFGKHDLKPLRRITNRLGRWNDLSVFSNRINDFLKIDELDQFEEVHSFLLLKMIENDQQVLTKNIDALIYIQMLSLKSISGCDTAGNHQQNVFVTEKSGSKDKQV